VTPAARITLDGVEISNKGLGVLESVTITDEAGVKSDTCEISLDNREGFAAVAIGAEVRVWLGYEPRPVYMGSYKVDSWSKEGPLRRLTVSAKSAELTSEIKASKVRSWHDTTVGAIVRKIAGEHGLGAVIDKAVGARKIEHIDQTSESDMGFLSRLAGRQGANFKLADGKILFAARGSRKLASGTNKPAMTVQPSMVSSWSASAEERGGHKSVKCCYMDHDAGERVYVTAGSGKPCHRDRRLYGSRAEAEAAARAQFGDLERSKMTGQFDGPGMPEMFAEALLSLKGFDPDVDGEYLAKSVTHTFSASGLITSVSFETVGSDSDGSMVDGNAETVDSGGKE